MIRSIFLIMGNNLVRRNTRKKRGYILSKNGRGIWAHKRRFYDFPLLVREKRQDIWSLRKIAILL